jgi:putative endonuclease
MAGLVPATQTHRCQKLAAQVPPALLDGRDKPGHDEPGEVRLNAVYMMASGQHGTIYIGVTSDLLVRISQHRQGLMDGFTKRYAVKRLVWFEMHDNIVAAIQREKSLKKYKREWKVNLIERDNPKWADLFPSLFIDDGPLAHLQTREKTM